MTIFLLAAVLLGVAVGLMLARRKRARKRAAAELKAARLRALRKPSVPFVSASLRGATASQEPARPTAQSMHPTTGTSDRAA